MPTSFDAMHDETRSLRQLDPEPQAPAPQGLTLLAMLLIVLPVALAILL